MENRANGQAQARKPAARLLKTRAAAEYLAISVCELRLMVQKGLVPVVRLSGDGARFHFDVRDLDALVERQKLTLNNGL